MCVHTCVCWRGASKREELVTFYYRSRVSPFVIPASHTALQENFSWEFLGVPMIRTQRFHQGCPDSVPGGETKLLYGMAKNTKKENFLCLFPSTVLFQEPFTVVSVTWSLGNWGGGGNSEVRLLSPHGLLCLYSFSVSTSLSTLASPWLGSVVYLIPSNSSKNPSGINRQYHHRMLSAGD